MTLRAAGAVAIAGVAAAAIWALSPMITGHWEPWDAGSYYPIALVLAGFISGILAAGPIWAHYGGAVAGQVVYELAFLSFGPLFAVGLMFLLVYSLLFAGAAYLGSLCRIRLRGG